MKYRIPFILLMFFALNSGIMGQTPGLDDFSVKFNGYVKTDYLYDTRQVVTAREGHLLLFPSPELLSPKGEDLNGNPSFNILSVQSRLSAKIFAPDAFNAKTSGLLEGEFFGQSDGDINGFRLRHAFVKLDWEKVSLLAGQYWHPMFITEVYPGVISSNTGIPFQPFSRNPQVRVTYRAGITKMELTAYSQRDFSDLGPYGASSIYVRNSATPMMNFNFSFAAGKLFAGAGANFKSIKPKQQTELNYSSENIVSSFAFMGFAKYSGENYSVKFESTYGENLADLLMAGGYAVKSINDETGEEDYTNLKTLTAWTDLSYGKKVEAGLFAGYSKNLGANENLAGAVYARGANIDAIFRVAPRVKYYYNKVMFGAEVEYTSADYGTVKPDGKVENTYSVANTRLLLAMFLYF